MDKKTEIALQRSSQPQLQTPAALKTAPASPPNVAAVPVQPDGWWTYHGDSAHTGFVSDSQLNSKNVNAQTFTTLFTLQLGGPVLSVPAVTGGFIYVGVANYHKAQGGNGGALHKIDIAAGKILATFAWDLGTDSRDAHSFAGMGCTPAVVGGHVYFGAFNGKFYCLDAGTLAPIWFTDLRNEDPLHNQPITNVAGTDTGAPAAVIWSSPAVSSDGTKIYVGCGEGENPQLFSFVFCLDSATGSVNWIYCTNKFTSSQDNQPNMLPLPVLMGTVSSPFKPVPVPPGPISMGCSVWGAITYDAQLHRLFCSTGNQQPEPNGNWQQGQPVTPEVPFPGYSNGVLSLDADTGAFKGFYQVPIESCYRPSDIDIDLGCSPVVFTWNGQRVVSVGCKNGSCFLLDAATLKLVKFRQMLPSHNDGTRLAEVDPHPVDGSVINPQVSNDVSDKTPGENYSGVFNTGAVYPGSGDKPQTISQRMFYAMGGPNYHNPSPGIDFASTPFMRAIDLNPANLLSDAWPLDNSDPRRYVNSSKTDPATGQTVGMYASAGESGLSSPAVVNDVVFCSTCKVSLYAFRVSDGALLWNNDLGSQTDGYNGGYGYCLGPAIWKNYVVAGALVQGLDGGVLKIYGLTPSTQ